MASPIYLSGEIMVRRGPSPFTNQRGFQLGFQLGSTQVSAGSNLQRPTLAAAISISDLSVSSAAIFSVSALASAAVLAAAAVLAWSSSAAALASAKAPSRQGLSLAHFTAQLSDLRDT